MELTKRAPIFKNVIVTPEQAEAWLATNIDKNRKKSAAHINEYTAAMISGSFDGWNGETVKFDMDSKRLFDGQHRLEAVVASGTAQPMTIAYIDRGETSAFLTCDNGMKRKAADFIVGENKPARAAIAGAMCCMEEGIVPLLSGAQGKMEPHRKISRTEITDYEERNVERVERIARIARQMRNAAGIGSEKAYGLFLALVQYVGKDAMIDEFADDFCQKAPSSPTVVALKNLIMRSSNRKAVRDNTWLLGTLLDGYTHYLNNTGSVMLNKQARRIEEYSDLLLATREALRNNNTTEVA